jgi:hypothetical protein
LGSLLSKKEKKIVFHKLNIFYFAVYRNVSYISAILDRTYHFEKHAACQ